MTTRIATYVLAGLVGIVAMGALPVTAQEGPAKPVAAAGEKLSQALVRLSTADGFEIRGLERVGDETVQPPKSGSTVQTLRKILTGYAYTVELAPDSSGKTQPKLVRVSILGHSSDVAGDAAQSPAAAAGSGPADAGSAVATAGTTGDVATPSHPVTHMLQTLAQASMPVVPPAATDSSGQPIASAGVAGTVGSGSVAAASGGASSSAPAAPTMDPVNNPADMAALTHTASANLSALVQSLKAACPAGSKC